MFDYKGTAKYSHKVFQIIVWKLLRFKCLRAVNRSVLTTLNSSQPKNKEIGVKVSSILHSLKQKKIDYSLIWDTT